MKFAPALIALSMGLVISNDLSALEVSAARRQACDEFGGRWTGTGCVRLGTNLAAFRKRVEVLSGQKYEKPDVITLSNGVTLPRATVEAHRRCNKLQGQWHLTGDTGWCSK